MKKFTAYIDEAGDEGFGKLRNENQGHGQSRWLILGAIIIEDENRSKTVEWRNSILSKFPNRQKRGLHWRDFKHEQKVVISKTISDLPLGIGLTLSHKITIPGSKFADTFKEKGYLYNYLVRWLLERLIAAADKKAGAEPATLRAVFSRRGGTDYQSMKEYLQKIADGRDIVKAPRSTNWKVLDIENIAVENHSKSPGLQIADCATSAFFAGVEPNAYGNTEPTYGLILSPRLLNYKSDSHNRGITVVPNIGTSQCSPEQLKFLRLCRKDWQAPGS